jgi:hypothetical protein
MSLDPDKSAFPSPAKDDLPAPPAASPAGPAEISLPADARCFQCGYLLRGLTLLRCPECGRPFDPGEYYETYLPLWPVLVGLYLLGRGLAEGIRYVFDLARELSLSGAVPISQSLGLVGIALALAAAYGFLRRRRWARAVGWGWVILPTLLAIGQQAVFVGDFWRRLPTFYLMVTVLWQTTQILLPSIGLGVFLRTGMRRQSMLTVPQGKALPVARSYGAAQRDWLAFMILLLAGVALMHLYSLIFVATAVLFPSSPTSFNLPASQIWGLALDMFMVVWPLFGIYLLGGRPGRITLVTGITLLIWGLIMTVNFLVYVATPVSQNPAATIPSRAQFPLMPYLVTVITGLIQYGVLYIFARLARRRELEESPRRVGPEG